MDKNARIIAQFYRTPWAILPDRLPIMQMVLHRWASGVKLSDSEIKAAIGQEPQAAAQTQRVASAGAVAVIPLFGIVSQRMNMMDDISGPGGTSTEMFSKQFKSLLNDDSVGAIVINVDSPGGSVYGVQELADQIFEARSQKKIVAIANSCAASAAYWLASSAEEFICTPSGEVGSIGVYGTHEDWSENLAQQGVKVTLVSAGKYKTEGNPYQPLDDDAKAAMQTSVDGYYDAFVKGVARNRKASQASVREGYGQGRVLGADAALKEGMIDAVDTLDNVVSRLSGSAKAQKPKTKAESLDRRLRIEELT